MSPHPLDPPPMEGAGVKCGLVLFFGQHCNFGGGIDRRRSGAFDRDQISIMIYTVSHSTYLKYYLNAHFLTVCHIGILDGERQRIELFTLSVYKTVYLNIVRRNLFLVFTTLSIGLNCTLRIRKHRKIATYATSRLASWGSTCPQNGTYRSPLGSPQNGIHLYPSNNTSPHP